MKANIIDIVILCLCYCAITTNSARQNSVQQPRLTTMGISQKCSVSEFTCANGNCISSAKYCDSSDDCGDASDEPRFCTKCNRTYHGNVGMTYHIELHRPKEEKIPFACHLTFTAAGGMHGDIVQITMQNGFTLGKFTSFTQNGCQDGYLEISEASRPAIGGRFCGQSWGPAVLYSETRSIILTVFLSKLLRDQSGYNFDFRIEYKFLSKEESVVRFGGPKADNYENITKDAHHSSSNYVNKLSSIIKNSKDNDSYKDGRNSVSNIWYESPARTETTMATGKGLKKAKSKATKNVTSTNEPNMEAKNYLGDLIPGTYCSRIFSNCDKKLCRLQSPNFPGTYPRNLTCYYAVRQHDVPAGKHALITVRQPKGNLIWIIPGAASMTSKSDKEKFKPRLQTWDECDFVQDFVTIYDGYTTRDPTILKFCGGGQTVPQATSSGPELLVEFTTSPYGTFNNLQQDANLQAFNGFQLEVEVTFVDIQSPTYAKSKRLCEFWIRGTGHGVLKNPSHSIAPNTTCLYHLQGTEITSRSMDQLQVSLRKSGVVSSNQSRFKIWLSFLKFDYAPVFEPIDENMLLQPTKEDCSGMLRVFDGQLREVPLCKDLDCMINEREIPLRMRTLGHNHTNVIARFCRGSIPRSCDHGMLNETNARPCTMQESFLSSGDYLTLELKVTESTALRPLSFQINYEFVDLYQDGMPLDNDQECSRKFVSSLLEQQMEPIMFRGNRNIFLFGRAGARNLNCVYRFEAQRDERINIIVHRMISGNRTCASRMDNDTQRSYCYGDNSAKLEIFERPWHDSVLFIRNCICNSSSNITEFPLSYTSTSRELEVHFTAINMTQFDDPDSLNFEATFEFIKIPSKCLDTRRRMGSEGTLNSKDGEFECKQQPWLIEPSTGKYLYLRFRGLYLSRYNPQVQIPLNKTNEIIEPIQHCPTKSRIIVTTGEGITITACPLSDDFSNRHTVEVFSSGWHHKSVFEHHESSTALSVEFLLATLDYNEYELTWLELSRRSPVVEGIEDCQYTCPELSACVNASIWCDGKDHCPSGYDEYFTHCSSLFRLPAELLIILCAAIIITLCIASLFAYRKLKNRWQSSSVLQTRLKSLSSMDTPVFDEKDFIS